MQRRTLTPINFSSPPEIQKAPQPRMARAPVRRGLLGNLGGRMVSASDLETLDVERKTLETNVNQRGIAV